MNIYFPYKIRILAQKREIICILNRQLKFWCKTKFHLPENAELNSSQPSPPVR